MSEIIHFAGPTFTFGTLQRQRCTWCGALIDERDLANVDVQIDPTSSKEVQQHEASVVAGLKWEGLVAIDGNHKWKVPEPEDQRAPERSCMQLLPTELG